MSKTSIFSSALLFFVAGSAFAEVANVMSPGDVVRCEESTWQQSFVCRSCGSSGPQTPPPSSQPPTSCPPPQVIRVRVEAVRIEPPMQCLRNLSPTDPRSMMGRDGNSGPMSNCRNARDTSRLNQGASCRKTGQQTRAECVQLIRSKLSAATNSYQDRAIEDICQEDLYDCETELSRR